MKISASKRIKYLQLLLFPLIFYYTLLSLKNLNFSFFPILLIKKTSKYLDPIFLTFLTFLLTSKEVMNSALFLLISK